MKSSSWKKFLSVVLLLTMVVSMLPCAAFAEEAQPADEPAATEQTVKTEETKDEVKDAPKDAPKSETKDEAKDAPKDEVKDEAKDAPKDETKDEVKDETKDEVKDETKDEAKDETKSETKDETGEYSEAVKAFLAAAEAIDADAPDMDALEAALIQHDALTEDEQSLPEVAEAFARLNEIVGYGIEEQKAAHDPVTVYLVLKTPEGKTVSLGSAKVKANQYGPERTESYHLPYLSDLLAGTDYEGYTWKASDLQITCTPKQKLPSALYVHENEGCEFSTASASVTVTYSVSKWSSTGGGEEPTADYTVNYLPNTTDTVDNMPDSETYNKLYQRETSRSTSLSSKVPVREGYTFQGWKLKNEGRNINAGGVATIYVGVNNFYAQWEKKTEKAVATLKYDGNGNGDIVTNVPQQESKEVDKGTSATFTVSTATPVREGYTFNGWNTSPNGYGEGYNGGNSIEVEAGTTTTLYALWLKNPEKIEITLTYDPNIENGGSGTPFTDTKIEDEDNSYSFIVKSIDAIESITPQVDYEFVCWNTNKDGSGDDYTENDNINISENTTLYAQWKEREMTLGAITYWPNGGDSEYIFVTQPVYPGTYALKSLADVGFTAPSGKRFECWADSQTVTEGTTTYKPGNEVTIRAGQTLEFWAQWVDDSTTPPPAPAEPDWSKLEITKSVDPTVAMPGDTITYTITVKNNSDVVLNDVIVEDKLPGEVTYVSHAPASVNKVGNDYYTITTLGAKSEVSFTITAKVKDEVANGTEIKNIARVLFANKQRNDTLYATSNEVTTVVGTDPTWSGLSITKTVDKTTAQPGDELTYTIKVKNNTGAVLDYEVSDPLPVGVELIAKPAFSSYDEATRTVKVLRYSLAAGAEESFTITVKVLPDAPDSITNTAAITEATSDSNVEANKDILKDKTASATTEIVKPVTMPATVTVKFVGLDAATKLPAGYTLTGADTNELLKGSITPLTKDETAKTYTYTGPVSVVLGKEYTLNFTQTGYEVEGYTCDAAAAVTKTVTANEDDMEAGVAVEITLNYTKGGTRPVDMPVTVTVNFVGLDAATKLPAGYALTGADANELLKGSIAPLTKDETAKTCTYTGNVSAVPGKAYSLSFIHTGFAVDGYICTSSANPQVTVTADKEKGVTVNLTLNYTKVNWAGLTITKTADKTYATPGSYVKYTITVTNNTGVDLTNVNVLDYLPDEVRYSSSFGGYDSSDSTWTIARLANGKSATVTIRVRINSGLSTGTKIENTAYVTSVTVDGQECVFDNLWLNDTAVVTVTGGKGAPKTGDESNLGLWIAVMAASLACAGAAVVVYKKRRTGND